MSLHDFGGQRKLFRGEGVLDGRNGEAMLVKPDSGALMQSWHKLCAALSKPNAQQIGLDKAAQS